jgi:hypothetical protein
MNILSRLILNLVSTAVVLMCIGGAWLGLAALNSPQLWTEAFSDPRNAAAATRMAAGGFILYQACMGIVLAGTLSTLLVIEKNTRADRSRAREIQPPMGVIETSAAN